ncbi:uncharacterized protein LOC119405836 [Rhipicephalus sanguineus]|uniref:uncharacterized protein LOC119405836 n=1 Tax=Rhipicephalus sanguineus TaxID=34632 RepID=UPI0020C3F9C7|nr:uncharacterized protein LOC119405836 [Rhipicephalus sanguineus]
MQVRSPPAVDSTTEVVEHATVEGFQPKTVADFDATHSYDVWWNGNGTVDGGYYKAKVLHMTGSSATTAALTASGSLVPRQHNSGNSLRDVSPATSLPSVLRTSVASRSPTELPLPEQNGDVLTPLENNGEMLEGLQTVIGSARDDGKLLACMAWQLLLFI